MESAANPVRKVRDVPVCSLGARSVHADGERNSSVRNVRDGRSQVLPEEVLSPAGAGALSGDVLLPFDMDGTLLTLWTLCSTCVTFVYLTHSP